MLKMAKLRILWPLLPALAVVCIALWTYAATPNLTVPEDSLKAAILSATQSGREHLVAVLSATYILLKFSEMISIPLTIAVSALFAKIVFMSWRETILTHREQDDRKARFDQELTNLKEEGARAEALGGEEKKKIAAEIAEIHARTEQGKKKAEVEIAQIQSQTELEKKKSSAEIDKINQLSQVQSKKLDIEASQSDFRTKQRLAIGLISQISDPAKKSEMAIKALEDLILKPGEKAQ